MKYDVNWRIILSTRKHLLYSILCFIVSLILILVVVIPQIQIILDQNGDIKKERPIVDKLEAKLLNLDELDVSPEFARNDVIEQALPSKKPLLELLVSLRSAAQQTNIAIVNFKVSPGDLATESAQPTTTSVKGYDYLELEVEIEGTFDQVQNYLSLVEKITPFTTISRVTVETGSTTQTFDAQTPISAEIETRTHYFVKQVQASTEASLPVLTAENTTILDELASYEKIIVPEQTEIQGGGNQEIFGDVLKFFTE